MQLRNALIIIKSYHSIDIENNGVVIRKEIRTGDVTSDLLNSYLLAYGTITIIPKRLNGAAPTRLLNEKFDIEPESKTSGLNGISEPAPVITNHTSEMYKVLYENAKEDAREYKRKYEDAVNDKHKAEIELAGSKNSFIGDLASGLSGFAPMLMGGTPATPALGEVGETQHSEPTDVRLKAINNYYSKLDEPSKVKVYKLLVRVFSDISILDKLTVKTQA